jgi:hypothetical protein
VSIQQVALWQFADSEFPAWRELVGKADAVATLAEYAAILDGAATEAARVGVAVVLVRATVAEVRATLAEHGLDNTPDGRAAAIGLLAGKQEAL